MNFLYLLCTRRRFPEVGIGLTKSFSGFWFVGVITAGGPMSLRQALNSVGIMFQHSIVNSFTTVATQTREQAFYIHRSLTLACSKPDSTKTYRAVGPEI